MGRSYPADEIQGYTTVHDGVYVLEVEDLHERPTKQGKLNVNGQFRIVSPEAFVGLPVYDSFLIGTAEDPQAENPATWTSRESETQTFSGAKRLKQLFIQSGITQTGDLDLDCLAAVGRQVVAEVYKQVEKATNKDGTENPFAGRVKIRIREYYPRTRIPA